MKILIAVDSSPFSRRLRDYLTTSGSWLTRAHRYTVLTAVPGVPVRATSFVPPDPPPALKDIAEDAFAPFRTLFRDASIEAEFRFDVGAPSHVIARAATEGHYDLVMLGSHGDGAMKNMVLGSVVTQVLALCEVPALIVR